MKKLYFVLGLGFIVSSATAQTKSGSPSLTPHKLTTHKFQPKSTQADGDTIMYFDGSGFFVNPTDNAAFGFENIDEDGLTPVNAGTGWESDWNGFYSLDPNDFSTNDVDTAEFVAATSWFDPIGVASNWFTLGPITIPAGGGELSWRVKNNPGYTDSYDVMVGTTGTSLGSFINDPADTIFKQAQLSGANVNDTIWVTKTASLTNYAGLPIYVAVHHTANDGDVLYLDEIVITEKNNVGIKEVKSFSNTISVYPNPTNGISTISFVTSEASEVTINIVDITGKKVANFNQGLLSAGQHSFDVNFAGLPSGIYAYNIVAGSFTATKSVMVK